MDHGITLDYLRTMADKAETTEELKNINRRVENVFDASFKYGLISLKDYKRLFNKWLEIQCNKEGALP